MQASGSQDDLVVVLTDSTDVAQVQGMLKARKKDMSMAALVPGLPVKVEGTYNDQHQLVADKVRFKGNDLRQAQAIEAGMNETKLQTQQSKEELEKQRAALEQQQARLAEIRPSSLRIRQPLTPQSHASASLTITTYLTRLQSSSPTASQRRCAIHSAAAGADRESQDGQRLHDRSKSFPPLPGIQH